MAFPEILLPAGSFTMSLLDFISRRRGGPADEERADLHVALRRRIPRENGPFFHLAARKPARYLLVR